MENDFRVEITSDDEILNYGEMAGSPRKCICWEMAKSPRKCICWEIASYKTVEILLLIVLVIRLFF